MTDLSTLSVEELVEQVRIAPTWRDMPQPALIELAHRAEELDSLRGKVYDLVGDFRRNPAGLIARWDVAERLRGLVKE